MKKIISFLILFMGFSAQHYAARLKGQARIDSLVAALPHAKDDSNKVTTLNTITFAYSSLDPGKGLKYGLQGLALAEKLKFKRGEGIAHNLIGLNYQIKADVPRALEHFFKSLKILEEIKDLHYQGGTLNNIGSLYQNHPSLARILRV